MAALVSSLLWPAKARSEDCAICLSTELKSLSAVSSVGGADASQEEREVARAVADALGNAAQKLLAALHLTCKHLSFWEAKSKMLPRKKVRTIVLERGPWEFFVSMAHILQRAVTPKAGRQSLVDIASASIQEKVALLRLLKDRLATALGKVYCTIDNLTATGDKAERFEALLATLSATHESLQELEGQYDLPKVTTADTTASGAGTAATVSLELEVLSWKGAGNLDPNARKMQMENAIHTLLNDGKRLEGFITLLMFYYGRPRKAARFWVQYTAAGVGLAIASGWFIRHSKLSGSNDLEKWISDGCSATVTFYRDHALAPLVQIRDDVLQTFRGRAAERAGEEEVHLSAESLRRMLLEFAKQVTKAEVQQPMSDLALMEIMMSTYEKEMAHPIQSLVGGELARAMLIQVQKLKLDIETALLELDQILRANEINFAVLAALPALFVTMGIVSLIRQFSLYRQGRGREGRGRAAHLTRRMLMADVERILMESQISEEGGRLSPRQMGLLLYSLHKLHKSVEKHAQSLGEWSRLQVDLSDLASPNLDTNLKLAMAARIGRIYDTFVPLPNFK